MLDGQPQVVKSRTLIYPPEGNNRLTAPTDSRFRLRSSAQNASPTLRHAAL